MKYIVITNKFPMFLSPEVEKYLNDGWKLQGGVSVCSDSFGSFYFSQALVK